MTVSSTPTFEQSPAHRPAESDILNGAKSNVTPTVPPHMPAAEEYMQIARLLIAACKMAPLARISVDAGVVVDFATVRTDIVSGDITVTVNGTGDVSLTFPANKFPFSTKSAMASLNDATGGNRAPSVEVISNGVRVRTTNGSGSATNLPFTVALW